jgi:hypothetical protein
MLTIPHWNMKTKTREIEKDFDTVKTFRAIKEKISLEMATMNFEQIKEYLKTKSRKFQTQ